MPTNNVKVKELWADASVGLPNLPADFWTNYPNDWAPSEPKVLMWNWNVPPSAADHTGIFVAISSDEDPVIRSDANPNDHVVWVLVPNDKHVTLRNLHVITAAAPPSGQLAAFTSILDFHNPYPFQSSSTWFSIAVCSHATPGS